MKGGDLTRTQNQSGQNPHRRYSIALLRLPQFVERVGDHLDPNAFDTGQTRRIDRHRCYIFARDLDRSSDGRVVRIQSREESLECCQSEGERTVVRCVEYLREIINDDSKGGDCNVPRCSSLQRIDQPILHTQQHRR